VRRRPSIPRLTGAAALVSLLIGFLATAYLAAAPAGALTQNEPAYSEQWGMQKVGAAAAWAKNLTGQGVTIGIVDSGIDFPHEDFAAPGKILPGNNLVTPGTPPQDDFGHGTHVAGIAAALTGNGRGVTGVAPDARILPVKVLDSTGHAAGDVNAGIHWAVDNGAQVVNISIGDLLEPVQGNPFTEALRYAWSKGVVCVLSAGNSYVFNSAVQNENAIVVSATTMDDSLAGYSNGVGSAKWGMAAPGGDGNGKPTDILSTYWVSGQKNQYAYDAGTSMAAPHVTGAIAVLLGAGFTPQQAVDRLLSTAKDLGTPGRDSSFGAGRLDVARAVADIANAPASTPTTRPAASTPTTTARASGGTKGTTATTAAPGTRTGAAAAATATAPSAPTTSPADAATTDQLFAGGATASTTAPAASAPASGQTASGRAAVPMRRISTVAAGLGALALAASVGATIAVVWMRRRDAGRHG
jgi:serine protease